MVDKTTRYAALAAVGIGGAVGAAYLLSKRAKAEEPIEPVEPIVRCGTGYHYDSMRGLCVRDTITPPPPSICPSGTEGVYPDCTLIPGTPTYRERAAIDWNEGWSYDTRSVNFFFYRTRVVGMLGTLNCHLDTWAAAGICGLEDARVKFVLVDTVTLNRLELGRLSFGTTFNPADRSRPIAFGGSFVCDSIHLDGIDGCLPGVGIKATIRPYIRQISSQMTVEPIA